jgi:hypothetical protein
MVKVIHTAMDARRQRIVVSQSAVGTVNLTMLMTVARTQNHIHSCARFLMLLRPGAMTRIYDD